MCMDLDALYEQLRTETVKRIREGSEEWDPLIDSPDDDRYGITLQLRPGPDSRGRIRLFLQEALGVEPDQYAYPESDLHITVMSIISCFRGFRLEQIEPEAYIDYIRRSIGEASSFRYWLKGVTASPSCLMIQGYFEDDILNRLRDRLRKNFGDSRLQHSIDSRYRTESGHCTVFRLRRPLTDRKGYLGLIEGNVDRDFGTFRVSELELVANDWYQRSNKCRVLQRFPLR